MSTSQFRNSFVTLQKLFSTKKKLSKWHQKIYINSVDPGSAGDQRAKKSLSDFDLRFPPKIGLLLAPRLVILFNPGWSYFDPYTIQFQLKVHFALVHRRMFSILLFMLIFVGRRQRVHLVPKPHWNSSASSGLRQESEESNFNCSLHHLNATTTFLNKERNMIWTRSDEWLFPW